MNTIIKMKQTGGSGTAVSPALTNQKAVSTENLKFCSMIGWAKIIKASISSFFVQDSYNVVYARTFQSHFYQTYPISF